MSVNFNVDLSQVYRNNPAVKIAEARKQGQSTNFAGAIDKSIGKVNGLQNEANASITDLLTGKQQDINTVVASVAKADMSFKLLVGVRNKLVEAYKETMKMQG